MKIIPQVTYANALFNKGAGTATDKAVSSAVMNSINDLLPAATNKPKANAPDIDVIKVDHKADTKSSISDTEKLFKGQGAGSISLVLLGEDHNDPQDKDRAEDFIDSINKNVLTPTIVVFERAMLYNAPTTDVPIVREENLTTVSIGNFAIINGLSAAQRSMIVAGFLVLLVAGGNQNDIDKIILFYGENHTDILPKFSYYARHTEASYLLKRQCTAFSIRSNVK